MNNRKLSDYVVLWNVGASVAYVLGSGLAIVACLEHFGGLGWSSTISPSASFGPEFALTIIAMLLSVVVCVLNLIYAQNYFRQKSPKRSMELAATIGFIVLVGFQLCRSVSGIATYLNSNHTYNVADGIVTILNIVIWGSLIFDVINATLGTLAFWYIFKKVESENEELDMAVRVDGEVKETRTGGIAAEVADHAMGHPKPSQEMVDETRNVPSQELNDPIDSPVKKPTKEELAAKEKEKEEKAKKELPPILSANPDNEMLGKINREERVLKMDLPTFASPDDVRKSLGDSHQGSALPPTPTHAPTPKKRPAPAPMEADFEEDSLPVDKSED